MKLYVFLAVLLFSFVSGQKDLTAVGCFYKSFQTKCAGSKKVVISEILFSDKSEARPVRVYGRFKDLSKIRSERFFEKNTIEKKCSENIKYEADEVYEGIPYDKQLRYYYAQNINDDRKFYFQFYESRVFYKGTVPYNKNVSYKVASYQSEKYRVFYNQEKEADKNYEAEYFIYNKDGDLSYSFHQRGNQFDEYRYDYIKLYHQQMISAIYKNGILFEKYSYEDYKKTYTMKIREYIVNDSYQIDEKGKPYVQPSKFIDHKTDCSCKKGYVTKIEIWKDNQCEISNVEIPETIYPGKR